MEIFRAYGGPVVDAADLLRDPAGVLRRLCDALGIAFDPAMLRWPPGRRDTDGVWAPHWYAAVERSTGFAPYDPTPAEVPRPAAARWSRRRSPTTTSSPRTGCDQSGHRVRRVARACSW